MTSWRLTGRYRNSGRENDRNARVSNFLAPSFAEKATAKVAF